MKRFFIIGNPISHSLSPTLHNYWFRKYNIEAEYGLLEAKEDEIKNVMNRILKKEVLGINVTLPYKQKVIPFLSEMVNDAKDSNSVNTINLDSEGRLIGENTDVFGFQAGYLKSMDVTERKNKKVIILGAGGVSPSIVLALIKSNITNITISNRTYEKSLFIKKQFKGLNILKWEEHYDKIGDFDVIINATSLGLKSGQNFERFYDNVKNSSIFIDTIYNPIHTEMSKHLKSKGVQTYNGLDMFIYQGQKSFYIWNKINPEIDDELVSLLEGKMR
jgi:shikimate dehydrogenase